jgi:predicted nucleic acid-binding protein
MERGLDSMLIAYALLEGHPASAASERFIRERTGWFTTALVLLEVKAVLTKVYGVDPASATNKLVQLAAAPLLVLPVGSQTVATAMATADSLQLDLTDAVLLETARARHAEYMGTDDGKLAQASARFGIKVEHPFDDALRTQVGVWEAAHLPAKGLPRVLGRIQQWLAQTDPRTAEDFRSLTGGGSHLP